MDPRDFLPPWTPKLNLAVVCAAHDDIGEHEDPPGSNRGAYVDAVNQEFGSPLGSAWCANALGHWFKKAGASIPPDNVGSADRWRRFGQHAGLWTDEAQPGYAVIYGDRSTGLAHHVGIVEQIVNGRVLTIEGNTTLVPGYDREGWIVQQKEIAHEKVLGFVKPIEAGSAT